MEQTPSRIENSKNIPPCGDRKVAVGRTELRLDPFNVPVAKITPEKVIDRLARLMETKFIECFADLTRCRGKPRENPAVNQFTFTLNGIGRLRSNLRRCNLF